jgi:hypothetical protein
MKIAGIENPSAWVLRKKRDAVNLAQLDVDDEHFDYPLVKRAQGARYVGRRDDLKSFLLEGELDGSADVLLVVENQNRWATRGLGHGDTRGSTMMKVGRPSLSR